jgi:predicted esterase
VLAEERLPPERLALLGFSQGTMIALQVAVEWHVRPSLEHGIDQEGLALGAAFLRRVLA